MARPAPRLLVIDNYDSFTYNLVQMFGATGVELVVWRNDAFDPAEVPSAGVDGIVISPGPKTPADAGHSVEVIRRYGPTVPILGVCLGHQAIGAAYGARVTRATKIMHGKTSRLRHDGTGVFASLPDDVTVTRYHSLVVEDVPDELIVNAWADDDGTPVVMGVRHVHHPVWGVQFHPESILTRDGASMLARFVESVVRE
ncbi:MAG: aminodeoxychorismate/anthranilate synthase component II [Trueperaceae bacterium]|nr:aminodeoxychorismate/anthranilate synthase component II [Trueperaceae bacterium]